MPLLAVLDEAAFNALPDETVLGKDSYLKNEKENNFKLALDGEEAGKLAGPLQEKVRKLDENNKKLLDEKIKTAARVTAYEKLGKTPEEIAELIASGKPENAEELEKKYQSQIESLKTSTAAQLAAATAEIESAKSETGETQKQLLSTIKRTLIAELKNKFEMNALGDDFLSNRIEVVYDEDAKKYVPRVVENGEIAYKAGGFKTPEHLAEEARANKDLAGMFHGGTAGGSGADPRQRGNAGGSKTMTRAQFEALGQAEKHAFMVTDKGQIVG